MEKVILNNTVLSFEKVKRCKAVNLERLGETRIMNCGEIAFIVEYNNSTDITIQFKSTGELVKSIYSQFIRGEITSHFTSSMYGVGIAGLESTRDQDGKNLGSYQCWIDMLKRCYSLKFQKTSPSYIGCTVKEDWLSYSNFKVWYDKNYYSIDGCPKTELDKDILYKGNKIYSSSTCIFAPKNINMLFTKFNSLPLGVYLNKELNKYEVKCRDNKGKRIYLGVYKNVAEAFKVYKDYKESIIKKVAEEYKNKIPNDLYTAMINYEISEMIDL